MGTKHHYTEKECKVCHQVKQRSEFPKFGGLTCRICWNEQQKPRQKEQYQANKKNPKWVEQNRKRARDYKRNKKLEREREVTIAEAAAQLRDKGQTVATEIAGAISAISTDLTSIGGKLQQARELAENSTDVAAHVLGETHPLTQPIIGAAAQVVMKVEEIQALLSMFEMQSGEIPEVGGQLSQAFESAANQLMSGG